MIPDKYGLIWEIQGMDFDDLNHMSTIKEFLIKIKEEVVPFIDQEIETKKASGYETTSTIGLTDVPFECPYETGWMDHFQYTPPIDIETDLCPHCGKNIKEQSESTGIKREWKFDPSQLYPSETTNNFATVFHEFEGLLKTIVFSGIEDLSEIRTYLLKIHDEVLPILENQIKDAPIYKEMKEKSDEIWEDQLAKEEFQKSLYDHPTHITMYNDNYEDDQVYRAFHANENNEISSHGYEDYPDFDEHKPLRDMEKLEEDRFEEDSMDSFEDIDEYDSNTNESNKNDSDDLPF